MTQLTHLTAYKVAKLCNAALAAESLKPIPEQQVYRYMDQKLIPFTEVEGQRLISVEDAAAWIQKYVAKRVAKAATLTEVQAEETLDEVPEAVAV